MPEVKILEYQDVENGQHFRRKVKVQNGEDENGKPIIVEEWEYVVAHQFHGDPGFSVRQDSRATADGGIAPATVSGGGNGDYIVKDLLTGRMYAARRSDFEAQYERVSIGRLPKSVKEKLPAGELAEAEA